MTTKILVLDNNFYGLRSADDLVVHDAWDLEPDEDGILGALESLPHYDVVIVGNNLGDGLQQVQHLPLEQRGRTLITSNSRLSPVQREAYQKLGCDKFCTRNKIYYALQDEFGIEA